MGIPRSGFGGAIHQAGMRIALDLRAQVTRDSAQRNLALGPLRPGEWTPRTRFLEGRMYALEATALLIEQSSVTTRGEWKSLRQAVAMMLAGADLPGYLDGYRFALGKIERVERALDGSAPTSLTQYPSPAADVPRVIQGRLHLVGQLLHGPGSAAPQPEMLIVDEANVIVHPVNPEPGDDPEGFAMTHRAWEFVERAEGARDSLQVAAGGYKLAFSSGSAPEKGPLGAIREVLRPLQERILRALRVAPRGAHSSGGDPYADLRFCPDLELRTSVRDQ